MSILCKGGRAVWEGAEGWVGVLWCATQDERAPRVLAKALDALQLRNPETG